MGLDRALSERTANMKLPMGGMKDDVQDEMVARAIRSLCRSQVVAALHADLVRPMSDEERRAIRSRAACAAGCATPPPSEVDRPERAGAGIHLGTRGHGRILGCARCQMGVSRPSRGRRLHDDELGISLLPQHRSRDAGFLAQLMPSPPGLRRAEERILGSLLWLLRRALPWAVYFTLERVGGPKLRSGEVAVRAASFRCAWGGMAGWARCLRQGRRRAPSCGDGVRQPPGGTMESRAVGVGSLAGHAGMGRRRGRRRDGGCCDVAGARDDAPERDGSGAAAELLAGWPTLLAARVASAGGRSEDRAAELVEMCSRAAPPVAMQTVRFLCSGWACARRMGRLLWSCALGRVAEDALREGSLSRVGLAVWCGRRMVGRGHVYISRGGSSFECESLVSRGEGRLRQRR